MAKDGLQLQGGRFRFSLYLKQLFQQNHPLFIGLIGCTLALLMSLFYLNGGLSSLDDTLQDTFFKFRPPIQPRSDIIIISIRDTTLHKLGWPIDRRHFQTAIAHLSDWGARVIGINILMDNPNRKEIDDPLIQTIAKRGNVIMPVFYDYSNQKILRPLPKLEQKLLAEGNVAVYPSSITRHIEAQITPEKFLPMGVEMARISLGIPREAIKIQDHEWQLGSQILFPLERNGLLRINYQGPPDFFPIIPFEDVVFSQTPLPVKNKLVFIGRFDPGFGGQTETPYGNAAIQPMYSTELQAHIAQSVLNRSPIRQVPASLILMGLLLMVVVTVLFHPCKWELRFALHLLFILGWLGIGVLVFRFANLQVDIAPLILLIILQGLVQLVLALWRSTLMLKILARFPEENPYPVFRLDAEGTILYANPISASLLQAWNRKVGQTAIAEWQQLCQAVFQSNQQKMIELVHQGRVYSIVFSPITEAGYINVYGLDISARKEAEEAILTLNEELERRVNLRTMELKRSNDDLEHFAHVVSHDLREPLRAVISYLQLIERRYKSQLDAKADIFIDHAVTGARRMQQMLSALLTYSQVGAGQLQPEKVDCDAVLNMVLANLEVSINESSAEIKAEPLPMVLGEKNQIIQLFQNLLSNAIKFRKAGRLQIEIKATPQPEHWLFSIHDNGIGIEPQYQKRIFKVFQRLHTVSEYPGTGLGLSLCQKIVERNGGKIWVESQSGEGCTFFFTLIGA